MRVLVVRIVFRLTLESFQMFEVLTVQKVVNIFKALKALESCYFQSFDIVLNVLEGF